MIIRCRERANESGSQRDSMNEYEHALSLSPTSEFGSKTYSSETSAARTAVTFPTSITQSKSNTQVQPAIPVGARVINKYAEA